MNSRGLGTILRVTGVLVLLAGAPVGAREISDARRDIAAMRYGEAERSLAAIAKQSDGEKRVEALFVLAGLKKSASEAELIYQEIARLDPSGRWGSAANVELAKIRFALGEYREAFSILQRSGACRQSDEACYFQGLAAVMLKRYEEAKGPLSKVKGGRLRPWAGIALADADVGLDNRAEACRRYESMMRSPVGATAKYRYGECIEEAGDIPGALILYEEVRAEYSQTPEAILAGEKLEAIRSQAAEKPRGEPGADATPGGDEPPLAAGFTLQFGSFADRANAIKLAAELKRKISGVRIDSELLNFKEVHRVRSGYFKTRSEAEKRAEEIARQTSENCAIMPLP